MQIDRTGEYTLNEVFEQKLKIPNYQRPYSWDKNQVEQLINDLLEAYKKSTIYLIGNMILFQKEDKNCEIIDGQQRITTLALLFKVLEKKEKEIDFLENEINPLSSRRLQENYEILKNRFENYQDNSFLQFLNDKVKITYMKTDDLDEAFVLFDSQNTRGEPLKRKDILKVHHIHPIQSDRQLYAKKWEEWEKEKITKETDKLDQILYLICLARRGITNRLVADDIVNIDVFNELKTKITHKKYLQLNNYNQPALYHFYDYDFKTNVLNLITKPLQFKGSEIVNGIKYVPFEINSAIVGGESFFVFVYKYFELYEKLLEKELFEFRINGSGNFYLKKYYQAILLFYYDKFENENFELFVKKLLLLLSYLRLKSSSVRKETILHQRWNTEKELDVFSLIRNSYSSLEILDELDNYIKFAFSLKEVEINDKDKYKNVKTSYKKIFENFFGNLQSNIKEIKNER